MVLGVLVVLLGVVAVGWWWSLPLCIGGIGVVLAQFFWLSRILVMFPQTPPTVGAFWVVGSFFGSVDLLDFSNCFLAFMAYPSCMV